MLKSCRGLLVFFCACFLIPTYRLAAQTIFYGGGSFISNVNADGSGHQSLVNTSAMLYITLDRTASQMYWADTNTLRRANYDGSGQQDILVTTGQAEGLQVDHAADRMYWSERITDRIQRANLDGSNQVTLIPNVREPRGLRIDPINHYIYWVEFQSEKLRRANLDGSGVTDIITSGMTRPFDLALDIVHQTLYWAQLGSDPNNQTTGAIYRANLDGSGILPIATGLTQTAGVDVDPFGGKVYWIDGFTDTIQRAGLDGSNRQIVTKTPESIPQHLVLDVNAIPEPHSLAVFCCATLLLARRRFGGPSRLVTRGF